MTCARRAFRLALCASLLAAAVWPCSIATAVAQAGYSYPLYPTSTAAYETPLLAPPVQYFPTASGVYPASYFEADRIAAAPSESEAAPQPVPGSGAADCCDNGFASCHCRDRWYVGLSGGWQQRERVHEVTDPRTFIEFYSGFGINLTLGYQFDAFRIEAETTFMNNECRTAGAAGLASDTVGNVNLSAYMFNVYHDIDIDGWCWKPYLGAGIGLYQSELNGLFPDFFQTVGGAFATTPINATSNMPFAYQFRAGASRPLGERTDLVIGYRYFHGEELTFASAPFAGPGAPVFNPNGAFTHSVEFGLRVRF